MLKTGQTQTNYLLMWINQTFYYFGKIKKSHHKTEHQNDGGTIKGKRIY